jgi:hypothetical protein
MRDPMGRQWFRQGEIPSRLPAVAAGTVRSWVSRGRVRSQLVDGERWVCWDDVLDAERAARTHPRRRPRGTPAPSGTRAPLGDTPRGAPVAGPPPLVQH